MVAFLSLDSGEPFATGVAEYTYRPATEREDLPRVILPIEIEGIATLAVLDTAAPYVVCVPEIAQQLSLSPEDSTGDMKLQVRGDTVSGHLYRLRLRFVASQGQSLDVEATAFVPDADWGPWPCFIGLSGCLERMRFALDPVHDRFFFGPISNE